MKRTAILVLTVALFMVALSGAAIAATLGGTPAGDYLKGTAKADTIHGWGGDDAIRFRLVRALCPAKLYQRAVLRDCMG